MIRKLTVLTFVFALALMALSPASTSLATNMGTITVQKGERCDLFTIAGTGFTFEHGALTYNFNNGAFSYPAVPDQNGSISQEFGSSDFTWTINIHDGESVVSNTLTYTIDCSTPAATPFVLPPCPPNLPSPAVGCVVGPGTPAPTPSPRPTAVPSKSPPTNNSLPPTAAPTVAAATATPRIATLPSTSTGDNSVLLILVAMSLAGVAAGTYRFIRR